MSGIVVEKKDGKTIITVVQKEAEKPENGPERMGTPDAPDISPGRRTFLHDVIGRRLLFHLATGEEVEGILDGFDHESLRIEDAFLTGDTKQWRADWMILERRQLVAVCPVGRIRPRSPTAAHE